MKPTAILRRIFSSSVAGAALTAIFGLLLWQAPFGRAWVDASYDYCFRFGTRSVNNSVCLIVMDNEAFAQFHQSRGQPWDRGQHVRLLNKLADDGCAMVVMDSFFGEGGEAATCKSLASAMRRQRQIVLMAKQSPIDRQMLAGVRPLLPAEPFLSASHTNWGIAWLDPDLDLIVRRQWPFPSPGVLPSLPQVTARIADAPVDQRPLKRWLRYYGPEDNWATFSYGTALIQPTNYFRDKIVFIGTKPQTPFLDGEPDEFCTPYTRWTGKTTGGVNILLTTFLNLVNKDWLIRPPEWVEGLGLLLVGLLLGSGFSRMRRGLALVCGVAFAVAVMLAFVSVTYASNYWFPWMIVACGQVPCAIVCAFAFPQTGSASWLPFNQSNVSSQVSSAADKAPDVPGFRLQPVQFGEGTYGRVWLAQNKAGQWRAIKVVYLANFNQDTGPYEREFNGINRVKAISDEHPVLLRVEFVSQKFRDFFYYIMELGDSVSEGWEKKPSTYKPHDLAAEIDRAHRGRLSIRECLRLGVDLADALDFLHRQGLTHRDIKPQNILFVGRRPKLADFGLVAAIRPADDQRTLVGTPGYMPPMPEIPGTPAADIYSLGMVLYVISTGRKPTYFPEIATTLAQNLDSVEFFILNAIILRACHSDPAQRYESALQMRRALEEALKSIE
ncbi:MAG TPA: serine/threonine-protein kinase [Verrucomicrobiae bacterium]